MVLDNFCKALLFTWSFFRCLNVRWYKNLNRTNYYIKKFLQLYWTGWLFDTNWSQNVMNSSIWIGKICNICERCYKALGDSCVPCVAWNKSKLRDLFQLCFSSVQSAAHPLCTRALNFQASFISRFFLFRFLYMLYLFINETQFERLVDQRYEYIFPHTHTFSHFVLLIRD